MSKDNGWMVDLLSGKRGEINDYAGLINRKGLFDDLGDAFTEQSRQPAINGKQKMTNALMAGLGAGVKGSQTNLKEARLQELEKYTKQVALTNANLQIQLGQSAYKKAAFANYATSNFNDFKKWNDALGSGDGVSSNSIGAALFNRFKETNPDLAEGVGDFSHVHNGMVYTNNGNKSEGILIKDLMAPLVSGLPEELQRELPNLSTLTMQNKFKQSDLFENLTLEKERASITNQYSAANLHNAQARNIDYNMNAPKANEKSVAQNDLNNLLDEAEKSIIALGSKAHRGRAERYLSEKTPGGYGMSEAEAQIDTLGKVLRGKLFNKWGYSNQAEFHEVPSISFENSPEVNLGIIRKMRKLTDESSNQNLDTRQNGTLSQGKSEMVLMTDPDTGEQDYVPQNRVTEAQADGLIIAQ